MPTAIQPPAPWYAEGLRFTCTQCGNCCGGAPGFVWVSEEECEKLAALLGLAVGVFKRRHTRRLGGRRSLKEFDNGDCEFLGRDEAGRAYCTVYHARPEQCRTWPFWGSNLKSRRAWVLTGRGCPGIDTGQHHPLPVIQAALQRNAAAGLDDL